MRTCGLSNGNADSSSSSTASPRSARSGISKVSLLSCEGVVSPLLEAFPGKESGERQMDRTRTKGGIQKCF